MLGMVNPPAPGLHVHSYQGEDDGSPEEWAETAHWHRQMAANPATHPVDMPHHTRLAAEAERVMRARAATSGGLVQGSLFA